MQLETKEEMRKFYLKDMTNLLTAICFLHVASITFQMSL